MDLELVQVWRDGLLESVHRGHVAVVDITGRLLAWAGDPDHLTLVRSSVKPIQAMAVITSGASRRFEFSPAELAVMCASHRGQAVHQQTVTGIMDKLGLDVASLDCGVHDPIDRDTRIELYRQGGQPVSLHCNCSGKHAGMLAIALARGHDPTGYIDGDHPVQRELKEVVAAVCGVEAGRLKTATDGCGVPSYAMPLWRLAYSFARLASPAGLPDRLGNAAVTIAGAMTSHPDLVAGTGAYDTELMIAGGRRFIGKSGAEGVHAVGIADTGVGIAVKISDGNGRAAPPVELQTLALRTLITGEQLEGLRRFLRPPVKNARGDIVGQLVPVFSLEGDRR